MKKFYKYFLILPIIFIAIFTLFACDDGDMKSIKLSIPNYEVNESGFYTIDKYFIEGETKRLPLKAEIDPNIYDVSSLTFTKENKPINNNKDVIEAIRVRNGNIFIIFGEGIGQASITASYKRKDNSYISHTIKLLVSDTTTNTRFDSDTYVTTYSGKDIKDKYKVIQDGTTDNEYKYSYYSINTNKNNEQTQVENIINAGKYRIYCENLNDANDNAEAYLTVNKVILNSTLSSSFIASNYEDNIYYGDNLPDGIYYEGDVPDNIIAISLTTKTLYGIGDDSATAIGRTIEMTKAKKGSDVGVYETTVRMSLFSDFKKNYAEEYDVETGKLRIKPKEVILKGSKQVSNYGEKVRNEFNLYDYNQYVDNGYKLDGLTPLNMAETNYAGDISVNNVIYKKDGIVIEKNSSQLDVIPLNNSSDEINKSYGTYEVFFDNATYGKNLILKGKELGSLEIRPRGVTILPKANQFKNYGSIDPSEYSYDVVGGSFINHDTKIPPLKVVYNEIEGKPLGEGNYLATAGKYYYIVDETLNPNYDITLDPRATFEGEDSGEFTPEQIIKFEVKPCPIEIKLEDITAKYKKPTGLPNNNGQKLHTVGYYTANNNYTVNIEYVKINGILADVSGVNQAEAGKRGRIYLETGGYFYFDVGVVPLETSEFFLTYNTTMGGSYFGGEEKIEGVTDPDDIKTIVADGANYNISWVTSVINLTKQTVLININENAIFSGMYGEDKLKTPDRLFAKGYGLYYTATTINEDGNSINLALTDILTNFDDLLTFIPVGKEYTKFNKETGEFTEMVSEFKNVGKYRIFLSESFDYIEGQEFYQFELNEDILNPYFYEITPRPVIIEVDEGQGKVYGMADTSITYKKSNLVEGDDLKITGNLARVAGEDVGTYAINVGDLSFGENYIVSLSANLAEFTITQRVVTVLPYSYSYVYGEKVADKNGADLRFSTQVERPNEIKFDNVTIFAPEFIGNLVIAKTLISEDGSTQDVIVLPDADGYYPVNIDSEKNILSYKILQGENFAVKPNINGAINYTIIFSESSTLTITKRDVTVNVTAQQIDDITKVPSGELTLVDNYSVTYSDGRDITTNKNITSKLEKVVLNKTNNYYCDIISYDLKIYRKLAGETGDGEDITNNFNAIMGVNVVYRIDTTIIYLSIVNAQDESSSTYEDVYKGAPFKDMFKLVCLHPDYEIDSSSVYNFVYVGGAQTYILPTNVGSYVAKLDTSSKDFKIVLVRKNSGETDVEANGDNSEETTRKTIIFTGDDLNKEFDNFVLNTTATGYLNIRKATLVITNEEEVGFVSSLIYGHNVLPKLKEKVGNDPIFMGVNNETITLKTFTEINPDTKDTYELNYVASGFSFTNFKANYYYNIIVTIQAVTLENGVEIVNNNYESLTLQQVPLYVSAQRIQVDTTTWTARNGIAIKELVYDGSLKSLNLALTVKEGSLHNYTTSYSYQKLAISYENSSSGKVFYRNYNSETKQPVMTGEANVMDCSSLPTNITSIEIKDFNGTYYAIVNNLWCFVMQSGGDSGVSPDGAGAYICVATCNAYENFTFEIVKDDKISTNSYIQFACTFEIRKSEAVSIEEWKDEFFYTTRFDFSNQSSLPFEYNIYPSFLKKDVFISMNNLGDVSTGGTLPVKTHTAILTIDTDNYYSKQFLDFKVTQLVAEFIFPTLKTYVYIGKDIPVKTFLPNIRVVLKGQGNIKDESFYYDEHSNRCKDITLVYTNRATGEIILDADGKTSIAPYQTGSYRLTMEYGKPNSDSSNYYGIGFFDYRIEERDFTGSVRVENATINYSPLYTQSEFYELIKRKMFTIDTDNEHSVYMFMGNEIEQDRSNLIVVNNEIVYPVTSREQLGWLTELNSEGQHYITFEIVFKDTTLKKIERRAILTVKRKPLSQSDFNFNTTTQLEYTYDGRRQYNYIAFGSNGQIPLNPENAKPIETFIDGEYAYHMFTREEGNGKKYVELQDNMFNTIFEIRYNYEGDNITLFNAPIDPNDNYRVYYDIRGGQNYMSNGIGSPYKDFRVKKIGVLYIFLNQIDSSKVVYNGEDLSYPTRTGNDKTLGSLRLKNLITVKRDDGTDGTNVNFSLYNTSVYKDTYGVYLQVYYTDAEGNLVTEVKDVGSYKIHLSLAYTNDYDIVKYFTSINLNGVLYDIEDFIPVPYYNSYRSWYEPTISLDFQVNPANPKYTIDTWNDAFDLTSLATIKNGNELHIDTNMSTPITLTAKEGITIEIGVYVGNYYDNYVEISDGETYTLNANNKYRITIRGDGNYSDSAPIIIVVNNVWDL